MVYVNLYMCALQYCRQVKSINEKFYFTVLSHDRGFGSTWGHNFYMGTQNGSKLEI